MTEYTHRNGETEPPTIGECFYWFEASRGTRWGATFGCYYMMPPDGDAPARMVGCPHPIAELEGRWWGPIVPPWETAAEQPPDLGVQVAETMHVADRMG